MGANRQLRELHLFAGAGGGILGSILLGHRTVCAVEIEPYCRKVLLQRQRDGILPRFPIWDDVRTFDGKPWRGKVDVLCGGFPCQDISIANNKSQDGLAGKKSGLWFEMQRIIEEIQPSFVFAENSPNLRSKGLAEILYGLAVLGYDANWGVFNAGCLGADHIRKRMFILANSNGSQFKRGSLSSGIYKENTNPGRSNWWKDQPGLERVANGVADQMDRLKAIGNGQVPSVVKLAWETLSNL